MVLEIASCRGPRLEQIEQRAMLKQKLFAAKRKGAIARGIVAGIVDNRDYGSFVGQ